MAKNALGIVSTLAAASAIWGVGCSGRGQTGPSTPTVTATTAATDGVALAASKLPATTPATKDDVELVSALVDHHLMAVLVSESCLEKAVHDELRTWCESLVSAHGGAVQVLQSRQDQYGVVHEPEMAPAAEQKMARLSALRGAEFERELLETMARQLRRGATDASACVERARDAELVRLCRDIGRTQDAAATRVQAWLCSWYGRC